MNSNKILLDEVRRQLGSQLVPADNTAPPPGLSTGWTKLDRFLMWHGLPKGAISLFTGESGGATSLWVRAAAQVTARRGQWAAWVNEPNTDLTPWILRQHQVDLRRLLLLSSPEDTPQLLWALQELLSSSLFELVGCDLGGVRLREHHLLQLKKMAMRYQTSLVLITRNGQQRISPFCSLILSFEAQQVVIHRALHRPTPYILERRDIYADTLPQLTAGRRALCG